MSEDRIKSYSEKKIEKALGIASKSADDLSDLDDVSSSTPKEDDVDNIELRKEQAEKIQKKLEEMKNLGDRDFVKEMYKQIALEGFGLLQTTKNEMEIDPSPRYVEVMATLSNAVVAATDSFRDIETTDKKFELENKKIEMKGKEGPSTVTNIAFSGSLQDALRQLKSVNNDIKTIDIKSEKKEN
jgi:hypothetical protein